MPLKKEYSSLPVLEMKDRREKVALGEKSAGKRLGVRLRA